MKKITKNIPNFLTSCNILCGSIATALAFISYEYLVYAAFFIGIASIFDFADGFAARMLKAYSEMGKELDSLADMISFGMAPAAILFQMMVKILFKNTEISPIDTLKFSQIIFLCIPFLVVIFSGLRLAKFNIDTRQTENFIGLPTPANAIFIASIAIFLHIGQNAFFTEMLLNKYILSSIIVVFSYLLISELPMFSLKVKNLHFTYNKVRYVFVIGVASLVSVFEISGLLLIIPFYIVLSGINFLVYKIETQRKSRN